MNICFYTDFCISGMTGGIGRATTVLTDYFRQHFGWKVYSIYAFEADSNCLRTPCDGSIQLRLHDRLGFRRLGENYKKAAQFIKDNRIQVVIIQTSMDVVAKLQSALHKMGIFDVKVISVLHYSPGTDEFPISSASLWKNITCGKGSLKAIAKAVIAPIFNRWEHIATINAYRNAYRSGDLVILLSPSYIPEYQKFAKLNETTKLTAIPNCVPFEQALSSEEFSRKQRKALVVGRMVEYPKRISLILQMWADIETKDPETNWNLDIVGEGPDLETFRSLAETLQLKRCHFHGRQNPIEFYRNATLFFMTSEFEGFPMTLVEAQQMGCIPIAFDSFGSLKEVITDQEDGFIVTNNDKERFVQTALGLMQDETRRMQMMNNAIHNCKRYNQQNICSRWKDLLENLVK